MYNSLVCACADYAHTIAGTEWQMRVAHCSNRVCILKTALALAITVRISTPILTTYLFCHFAWCAMVADGRNINLYGDGKLYLWPGWHSTYMPQVDRMSPCRTTAMCV
jgi:hypothetical protein